MADSSGLGGRLEDSHAVELTGTVMVVIIIVLFFVVVLVLFFHLYAKWFLTRRNQAGVPSQGRRRRRFDFAAGYQEAAPTTALRRGLDPSVLKSIPVVVFHAREFKDGLECAVCLSDIAEGEKARLLPKCSHGFHVDCIDMWFQSHSTCPLCRNPVSTQPSSNSTASLTTLGSPLQENEHSHSHSESPNFPINTLFWGNQTQVNSLNSCSEEGGQGSTSLQPSCSTSSPSSSDGLEGALAIDIPRLINAEEEFKSPKSPATTRLKSFRRLLSRERRAVATPSSPNNIDVEQGACRDQS